MINLPINRKSMIELLSLSDDKGEEKEKFLPNVSNILLFHFHSNHSDRSLVANFR